MMDDFDFGRYGTPHRLFLQAMMSRSIIADGDFKPLVKLCIKKSTKDVNPEEIEKNQYMKFLRTINNVIEDCCNLKIMKVYDEGCRAKKAYLLLVNMMDRSKDPNKLTIKAMVNFAPFELEYLKLIVDFIIDSPMREISQIKANNLSKNVVAKKIQSQEAELILQKFKDHKWLTDYRGATNIRLATRFICEMEGYLKSVYKEVNFDCSACNKTVVYGILCQSEGCGAQFHQLCASGKDRGKEDVCCKCKAELPRTRQVPDQDDDDDDESISSAPSRKKRRFSNFDDSEEEDSQ